jgi:hypothetical protein
MESLRQALDKVNLPTVLANHIEEYLDIKSLKNWRLTSKQAFNNVESKVNCLAQSIDKPNLINKPFGPFLGSAWFQFMTMVYQCENCLLYETSQINALTPYDIQEAEEQRLCGSCYIDLCDVSVCEQCQVHTRGHNGDYCTECDEFFCHDCSTENVAQCDQCENLFCLSCMLLNRCNSCI